MASDTHEVMQQYAVTLAGWGCDLTVVLTDQGPYFLVRQLCAVLGLSKVQQQMDRIRERRVLQRYVCQLPVQTRGGKQLAWCIHRRAVGFWLGTIQDVRLRPEVQPRILELQEALLTAADRLLFGEVASDPVRSHLVSIEAQVASVRSLALQLEERMGAVEDVVFPASDEE